MASTRLCKIKGCGKSTYARALCGAHYWRWRRRGETQAHIPIGRAGHPNQGKPPLFLNEALSNSSGDECLIWPFGKTSRGYPSITIGGKSARVHRLVCKRVHGRPPSPQHQAAHICGRKSCINPRHLRWATANENASDKTRHGTHLYGQRHPRAKLTERDVKKILALKGLISISDLAIMFCVQHATVWRIHNNLSWKHLQ